MAKDQKLRCLNCFERISVFPKAEQLTCSKCGVKYVLAWRGSEPKIAGTSKDYAEEA